MGTITGPSKADQNGDPRIADALFSKVQQRVLTVLFGNPDRSFYANEIIALADSGTGAVQRELARLEAAGLVTVRRVGRQKHYQANAVSPVYEELCGLMLKTADARKNATTTNHKDGSTIRQPIKVPRAALQELARRYHIRRLALFGSAARGQLAQDSDIDLLVEFEAAHAPSLWAAREIQEDFSRLFGGRPVDIVSPEIMRNPYRRRTIERDLKVLYEAA